jgi:hypothetical protein
MMTLPPHRTSRGRADAIISPAPGGGERVGLEPGAVVDVDDLYQFADADADGFEKLG